MRLESLILATTALTACTKAGTPAAPATSPEVAAALAKAAQTTGIDEDVGSTHTFGPCTLSLRLGNVACDFGLLVYDSGAAGRKVTFRQPPKLTAVDKDLVLLDSVKAPRLLTADATGKVFKAVFPTGSLREVRKNDDGTYTGYLDGQGTEVTWTFDASLRLVKAVDPSTRIVTTYTYSAAGLVEDERGARSAHYTYDGEGAPLTAQIDQVSYEVAKGENNVTLVKKDKFDTVGLVRTKDSELLEQVAVPGGQYFFTYENGAVTGAADNQGGAITLAREATRVTVKQKESGNVIKVVELRDNHVSAVATVDGRETFARDAYGRVVEREDTSARRTRYAYDKTGHLARVVTVGPGGAESLVEQAELNEFGQILAWTDGVKTRTNTYDGKGRLKSQREESPGTTKTVAYEAYDDVGRPTKLRETSQVTEQKTTTVSYDARGVIVAKTEESPYGKAVQTLDPANGSRQTETTDATGLQIVYKKTVNPVDLSTLETKKVVNKAGLVQETTVAVSSAGAQKIEANESGVLTTQKFDAKGILTAYESRTTKDPAFAWVGEAVVAAARAKAQKDQPQQQPAPQQQQQQQQPPQQGQPQGQPQGQIGPDGKMTH